MSANSQDLRRNKVADLNGEPFSGGPIHLNRGAEHRLRRQSQVVHVLSGHAWITANGRDYVLLPRERLRLEPGGSDAIISALGSSPLVYEISA